MTPTPPPDRVAPPLLPHRIGFVVNLREHRWYQLVEASFLERARHLCIEAVLLDAKGDQERENRLGRELIDQGCQVVLVTPADTRSARALALECARAGVPLVCEANWVEGAHALVAIDDLSSGRDLGRLVGSTERREHTGAIRYLDLSYPSLVACQARSRGFAEGLGSAHDGVLCLGTEDGRGARGPSAALTARYLQRHPEMNLVFCIDDETAEGALDAIRAHGANVRVAGFGLSTDRIRSELKDGSLYTAGLAMFAQFVGHALVDTAVEAFSGRLPPGTHVVAPTRALHTRTLGQYYHQVGDSWELDLAAVVRLGTSERPVAT